MDIFLIIQKNISLTGDDKSQFDISKGNIKITKNNDNNDMVTVTVGTTSYDIPKNMEIYIVQSTSQTSNVIEVVQVQILHCFRWY